MLLVESVWEVRSCVGLAVAAALAACAQRSLDLGDGCCCERKSARVCGVVGEVIEEMGETGGSCISRRDAALEGASGPGGA